MRLSKAQLEDLLTLLPTGIDKHLTSCGIREVLHKLMMRLKFEPEIGREIANPRTLAFTKPEFVTFYSNYLVDPDNPPDREAIKSNLAEMVHRLYVHAARAEDGKIDTLNLIRLMEDGDVTKALKGVDTNLVVRLKTSSSTSRSGPRTRGAIRRDARRLQTPETTTTCSNPRKARSTRSNSGSLSPLTPLGASPVEPPFQTSVVSEDTHPAPFNVLENALPAPNDLLEDDELVKLRAQRRAQEDQARELQHRREEVRRKLLEKAKRREKKSISRLEEAIERERRSIEQDEARLLEDSGDD